MKKNSLKSHKQSLIERLKTRENIQDYLNAVIEVNPEPEIRVSMLLKALRNVVDTKFGISKISRLTELDRTHLYNMLSESGNPTVKSLDMVLSTMGLHISISATDLDDEPIASGQGTRL